VSAPGIERPAPDSRSMRRFAGNRVADKARLRREFQAVYQAEGHEIHDREPPGRLIPRASGRDRCRGIADGRTAAFLHRALPPAAPPEDAEPRTLSNPRLR